MGYNEYAGRTTLASIDDSALHLDAVSTKVPQMWGVQAWVPFRSFWATRLKSRRRSPGAVYGSWYPF